MVGEIFGGDGIFNGGGIFWVGGIFGGDVIFDGGGIFWVGGGILDGGKLVSGDIISCPCVSIC